MAQIYAFRAVHPARGMEQRMAALPYDVYSRREAYVQAARDRLSFLNIDRPETQFPEDYDMYAPEVYAKAGEMFRQQLHDGYYVQDPQACFYLYEQTMNGRSQTGITACASVDDYLSGVIRKHENTREEKELDRIRHVDVMDAHTGPIFLAYRKDDALQKRVAGWKEASPDFDFVSEDGIRHRGWTIREEADLEFIREAFQRIGTVYIADGHHRAASAVKAALKRRQEHPGYTGEEEWNRFLCVLFPDEELMIMDYNRVIKDLNGMTEETFLEKLKGMCSVTPSEEPVHPSRKGEVGLYMKSGWYRLQFADSWRSSDPVEGLDVSILQKQILEPVLGIQDPRTDKRISFVGGIRGLEELEKRVHTDCEAAFAMYPTGIGELFAVADASLLMPPKSTWFEPKLRSGLFIHRMESAEAIRDSNPEGYLIK